MLVSTDIAEMVIVVVVKAPAGDHRIVELTSHNAEWQPHTLQTALLPLPCSSKLTPASVEYLQQHASKRQRM